MSNLTTWALRFAVAGALVAVAGPLAYRLRRLDLGAALLSVSVGGLLSLLVLGVLVVAIVKSGQLALDRQAAIAAAIALAVGAFPLFSAVSAFRWPPIHDITTDTKDPPLFDAVVPLRAAAPNGHEYPGEEVAAAQRKAYPDLAAGASRRGRREAAETVHEIAQSMGWQIIAFDAENGRLEATATTFWFGFRDDVVVRIREKGGGSEIDLRSVSRVGRSDLGANAARIRAFLERLRAAEE